MWRRFSGLNFIQFLYIDYITLIILYIQECSNHRGCSSIQGCNRKFLGCTQWSTIKLEICWKYVLYEYTVKSTLLKSILSEYNPIVTFNLNKHFLWQWKHHSLISILLTSRSNIQTFISDYFTTKKIKPQCRHGVMKAEVSPGYHTLYLRALITWQIPAKVKLNYYFSSFVFILHTVSKF